VAAIAGAPCAWKEGTTANVVISDISDSAQTAFAGMFLSVAETGKYVFIQTKGYVNDAVMEGAVAAGDPLAFITDGEFKTGAIGTNHIIATALEADTAGFGDLVIL